MAWKYNPFTDALDLTGAGGTSYIDGVVADSSLLPTTLGTPALDSVYLTKAGSGVWLISRRPAGLYVRVANNGVAADWTYLGAFPEVNADGNWELYNSTDPTKELKFDLSGISTSTVRTLTAPNASGTISLQGHTHVASDITSGTFDNARINWAAPSAIGGTTAAAGTFTTLTANNGTLTASAPVLDLSQTWNASGTTFTGLRVNVTNTASATASLLMDLQTGGTTQFSVRRDGSVFGGYYRFTSLDVGFFVHSVGGQEVAFGPSPNHWYTITSTRLRLSGDISLGRSGSAGQAVDCVLVRDDVGVLAQRNAANAQTFRIYNTTDAGLTNFERGFMRWSGNIFQIGNDKGGTGSRRTLEFVTDGTARWRVGDGSISSNPSMLALGNIGIFGTNESYNVIIATGAQGTVNAGVFSPNGSNTGYLAIGESLHLGLTSSGTTGDVRLVRDAANILALRNGASTPQTYRIYNTFSSATSFERLNIRWASNECIIDAEAGSGGGTLRGIRFGSATTSLLGFYNATPIAQPAAVADATDAASTQARLNDLLARLRTIGIIAT
ncbi:MAG: hypothetical protein EBR82_11630 [Caulobacteraceae bacterium]|nr:hypothetical protein [Caulobacteraceae bacterium]